MVDVRGRKLIWVVLCALAGGLAAARALADDAVPEAPPLRWWKGNLHTHTLWSDGNDFPEMVAEWYRTHGYHFLALSDHNLLSEGQRWIKEADIVKRAGPEAIGKYRRRFGADWVETRDPDLPDSQIRLKPLSEFRALVEERGRFLMIQSEEISDSVQGLPIHLNATNLDEVIRPLGGATVREAIAHDVRAVQDQAQRKGREIMVHLNHPNFGFAITAEDLAEVLGEQFFEVFNGHHEVRQLGDAVHPPVERLWDIANTIRISGLSAPPLYGIANDDSHDYHGEKGARPGRGWTYVEAHYLTPEHLIRALKAGACYASTGVELSGIAYDDESRRLQLTIAAQAGVEYTTQFIGTPVAFDPASQPATDAAGKEIRATRRYSSDVGKMFATVEGVSPSYQLTGDELYVRAVVTASKPHPDPTFAGQHQQAWTQPVGWQRHLKKPAVR